MTYPRFSFVYGCLSEGRHEPKCIGRTVTWPCDGPSNPISQRTIPIQVTNADSMIARRAVAYLEWGATIFGPRKLCMVLLAHLDVEIRIFQCMTNETLTRFCI